MKPEAISPVSNQERLSTQPSLKVERKNDLKSIEKSVEFGSAKIEQTTENSAITADVNNTTILPTPVNDTVGVDNNTTLSNTPLVANDDDLIEKEWVDRAKKIVIDTQNDPHKREDEVSKLQVDYIKKRFGRELGAAE